MKKVQKMRIFLMRLLVAGFWMAAPLSAASVWVVSNAQVVPSASVQTLSFEFSNVLNSSNSGVNWIRFTKPSVFDWPSTTMHTNARIRTYADGVNLTSLTLNPFTANWSFPDSQAMVWVTNTDDLMIVLGNQITNNSLPARTTIFLDLDLVISNEFNPSSFTAYVDAVQYNSMPTPKKNLYSTTGMQRSVTNPTISRKTGPSAGYASVIPQTVYLGAFPYTFTFYVNANSNANLTSIKKVAIAIPPAFTNQALFTNFTSIILGTNISSFVSFSNGLPGLGSTNWIHIDYSSAPIAARGLDVLTFKYTGELVLGTNLVWTTLVDGSGVSSNSAQAPTNANFPSQLLTVGQTNTSQPWDYQLQAALNVAPVAFGLSNRTSMSYVDIQASGQVAYEAVTNMVVQIGGGTAGMSGIVELWKDPTNGTAPSFFLTNRLSLVTNLGFTGAASSLNFALNQQGQNTYNSRGYTRYWLAALVTNAASPAYTNTLSLLITNIKVTGLNGSNVGGGTNALDSASILQSYASKASRLDSLVLHAWGDPVTNTNVLVRAKQGSFDNLNLKFVLSNTDPDATNYLTAMRISNAGTADTGDLGFVKVFQDNGDGAFSATSDSLILAAAMGTNRTYALTTAVPIVLAGTNGTLFWVSYDVKYSANVGRTVDLRVLGGSNFTFYDSFASFNSFTNQAEARPSISSAPVFPLSNGVATVISSSAQNYDFTAGTSSYTIFPVSLTTNQFVPVGSFTLSQDTENTNGLDFSNVTLTSQTFRGIQGVVLTSNTSAQALGMVYLYRDSFGTGTFSNLDALVGSNALDGSGAFAISNFALSNVAVALSQTADTFFLVYKLTNQIDLALTNTLGFRITNVLVGGPDGGVVANLDLVTNNASRVARLDSSEIVVSYVSNAMPQAYASQQTVKNKYLQIALHSKDPDAVHTWTAVNLVTNALTTFDLAGGGVNPIYVQRANGTVIGDGSFSNGGISIALYNPETIAGTNDLSYFVTFDVNVLAPVNSNFGLAITNGAFTFGNPYNDGISRRSFATGNPSGPALVSNVTIQQASYNIWDFFVTSAGSIAPASIGVSNDYAMYWADVRSDVKNVSQTFLTNVLASVYGTPADAKGILSLYRDTNDVTSFSPSVDKLVTNAGFSGAGIYVLNLGASNENGLNTINSTPDQSTRFWLTLRITNADAPGGNLWTNRVGAWMSNFTGRFGNNEAVVTNVFVLTNLAFTTARVDSRVATLALTTNVSGVVKQGTFNNLSLGFALSNQDVDQTNYLSRIVFSNAGSAQGSDLGFVRLYQDGGNGSFEATNDTLLGLATLDGTGRAAITLSPAVAFGPGTKQLWVAYDVDLAAVTNRTVSLGVAAQSSNVVFVDSLTYSSYASYVQPAALNNSFPLPATAWASNGITAFNSQPYDFLVVSSSYASAPVSVTSNRVANMGNILLLRDPDVVPVVLTNLDVKIASTGTKAGVAGWAFLARDTNLSGAYDVLDPIVGSNQFSSGSSFSIPVAISNVSLNSATPDRFFLLVSLTNAMGSMVTDRFVMSITNLSGLGADGTNGGLPAGAGFFSNLGILTNAPATETRVDDFVVNVVAISNYIPNLSPKQYDSLIPSFRLSLAGSDPDATNYLASIDVVSNGVSIMGSETVGQVKVATNTNSTSLGATLAQVTFSGLTGRLSFSPALALVGTNRTDLFVGFDVGSSTNVIGKKVGLKLTNGGLVFSDPFSDGYDQTPFVSAAYQGPTPETNLTVFSYNSQPWDFKLDGARNLISSSIGTNDLYLAASFDLFQDQEDPTTQALTNVRLYVSNAGAGASGEIRLYRDASDVTGFSTNVDSFLTNGFFDGSQVLDLPVSNQNQALFGQVSTPTRYWVALRVTNGITATFTNRLMIYVSNLMGKGPNAGLFDGIEVLQGVTNTAAQIDDHRSWVAVFTNTNEVVRQASADNLAMRVEFTNLDPNGAHFLSSLVFTNRGTASNTDLGSLKVYRDDGDGVFNKSVDGFVASASFGTNQRYDVVISPLAWSNGVLRLWAAYDVASAAVPSNTVELRLVSNSFYDSVVDSSFASFDQSAKLVNPAAYGQANLPSYVTWADSRAWDVEVSGASWSLAPQAFTTNELVPMGYLDLYEDLDVVPLRLTNLVVQMGGSAADTRGILSAYRGVSGSNFSSADSIGSLVIPGGAGTWNLPISTSNLAVKTAVPPAATRVWLAFRLTNQISLAKSDSVSFRITNAHVTRAGAEGTVFDGNGYLTGSAASVAQIYHPGVQILFISNDLVVTNDHSDLSVKNNTVDQPYVRLRLAGLDPETTNRLVSLDVRTNGRSDLPAGKITAIKIFTNKGAWDLNTGYFGGMDTVAFAAFDTNYNRVQFVPPLELRGTNAVDLYVSYGVKQSASPGSNFSMVIVSNSLVFSDPYQGDAWAQTNQVSGELFGPTNFTNVTVISAQTEAWDIKLWSFDQVHPSRAVTNVEFPVFRMDFLRDNEGGEALSNLTLTVLPTAGTFNGVAKVYFKSDYTGYTSFGSGSVMASIPFSNASTNLVFVLTNAAISVSNLSRFYIAIELSNATSDAGADFSVSGLTSRGVNATSFPVANSTMPLGISSRVLFDDPQVVFQATDLVSGALKQNSEGFPAMKIQVTPSDVDANFQLERLTFTTTNKLGKDNFLTGRLFRESGSNAGYDASDASVSGIVKFTAGVGSILLNNPIVVSNSAVTLYLTLGATGDAEINNELAVYFPTALNVDSFRSMSLSATNIAVRVTNSGAVSSGTFKIQRWVEFTGEEQVKVASTILDLDAGKPFRVFIREASLAPKLTVTVFDAFGSRIRSLNVVGDTLEWDGKRGAEAAVVPSGMYVIVVTAPNLEKRYRVFVRRTK